MLINREQAIAMVEALPVAEINGAVLVPKKRIINILEFLPTQKITTNLRRNRNSEVFCQNCEGFIHMSTEEAAKLTYCPHCGLEIVACKF